MAIQRQSLRKVQVSVLVDMIAVYITIPEVRPGDGQLHHVQYYLGDPDTSILQAETAMFMDHIFIIYFFLSDIITDFVPRLILV